MPYLGHAMKTKNNDDVRKAGSIAGGAAVGTSAGLAGSAVAISSSGAVAGLSGAGITSGLTAVGGSILGGAAILTVGTVILAGAGAYGGYKLFRRFSRKP